MLSIAFKPREDERNAEFLALRERKQSERVSVMLGVIRVIK